MQLARRLYLYFISAVSLVALAVGLTKLLELLITAVSDLFSDTALLAGDDEVVRRTLSLYAAIAMVALPIWLLHWILVMRVRRGTDADEERRSPIRALYLAAVLAGAQIALIVAAIRMIQTFVLWAADSRFDAPGDGAFWLALLFVSGAILAYHGWLRVIDMREGPLEYEADWLPRLYLYGTAFIGVSLLTFAVGDLLALVLEVLTTDTSVVVGSGIWDGLLASGISRTFVGFVIWAAAWQYSQALTSANDWRGLHARRSALRRLFGYAVAFGAVLATLLLITRIGSALLTTLFDATQPNAEPFVRRLLDPTARALPFIAAWVYYRRIVLAEAARFTEEDRQATVRRVYVYSIALIGLALTGYGLSGAIGVSLDQLTASDDIIVHSGGHPWRTEIAHLTSLTLVGLATWLWHWSQAQRSVIENPANERRSTFRRAYLLTSIAGGIVALLISLAIIIYRIFSRLLNVDGQRRLIETLDQPLAVLLVATGILAYHVYLLRADLEVRIADDDSTITVAILVTGPAGTSPAEIVTAVESGLPRGFRVQTANIHEPS